MRSIEGAFVAVAVVAWRCCFVAELFDDTVRRDAGGGCDDRARARARRHDAHAHDDVLVWSDRHEVWKRPFILEL